MSRLMQMDYESQKRARKAPRSAPNTPPLAAKLAGSAGNHSPATGRPSPSLHSRLVHKELLNGDGERRGSLENLRQLYGLEREAKIIGQLIEVLRGACACLVSSFSLQIQEILFV